MTGRFTRLVKAHVDLFSAALEAKAAELREYAKRYSEREWTRGYAQGFEDARKENESNHKEQIWNEQRK
jgi:hypothetical protein